jgi:LPXTG-motif cell wall-anchored protein
MNYGKTPGAGIVALPATGLATGMQWLLVVGVVLLVAGAAILIRRRWKNN